MIDLRVDLHPPPRLFGALARQLPFAISTAINETLKDVQTRERARILTRFTIRRRPFAERAVKIKPFSTKRTLAGVVKIEPPGGPSRADIFAKFERGGTKRPRDGQHIAVPIDARRTKSGVVSKTQRPKAFRFVRRTTRRGKVQARGERRTFIITNGSPGIYQRVGRGRSSRIRLLYAFERSVRIDRRLHFVETARRTVRERYARNFHEALLRAIRTAR